jgi:hypothetical protein
MPMMGRMDQGLWLMQIPQAKLQMTTILRIMLLGTQMAVLMN